MKKRERLLLQILACIALFAGVWIFFLDPVLEKKEALEIEQEVVQLERENVDRLIQADLEPAKAEETKRAEQNYQFFYGVLNSYNIDEILNGLAKANSLNIQSLQMGEYEDASEDFVITDTNGEVAAEGTDTEDADVATTESTDTAGLAAQLLKCSASLTVTGNQDNILAFVDAMNAKSSCLKSVSLSISQNQQDVSGSYANTAQIEVEIYGISTIEEK